jgi:hypothetical protein
MPPDLVALSEPYSLRCTYSLKLRYRLWYWLLRRPVPRPGVFMEPPQDGGIVFRDVIEYWSVPSAPDR